MDRNFVMDFEAYLKIEYKLDTNSSEKLMRIFKRITTMCFKNGQMSKDLFCDHKLKKSRKIAGISPKQNLKVSSTISRITSVSKKFETFSCFAALPATIIPLPPP
ncbi:MAG: phage integrase SAM-like domain-containing protein [Alistipes indistinctus]